MDMYNLGKFVGLLVGIGAGLLITWLVFHFLRGKGHWEFASKYDERQKNARGTAYMAGFWTAIIYLFAWFLLNECGFYPLDTPYMLVIGMTLALSVQVCISIWKDAYYGINDDPKKFLTALFLIDLGNTAILISELVIGIDKFSYLPWLLTATLVMGVCVFVTFAIRTAIGSKEDAE